MSKVQIGTRLTFTLVPPVKENSRYFEAGTLTFVVESRLLTDEVVAKAYQDDANAVAIIKEFGIESFDDAGPSIHVFDAATSMEVLRFDMFEHQPHYHYIHNSEEQTFVLFDHHADADVLEWSLQRLSNQMPSMLRFAGHEELAASVDQAAVDAAVVRIRAYLGELRTLVNGSAVSA